MQQIYTILDDDLLSVKTDETIVSKDTVIKCVDTNDNLMQIMLQSAQPQSYALLPALDGTCQGLDKLVNGKDPMQLRTETIQSDTSLLVKNILIHTASYSQYALYPNSWSTALEIFVYYKDVKYVISSSILNLLTRRLSKIDLQYSNKYYSTYSAIDVLDLHAMMNSDNVEYVKILNQILNRQDTSYDISLLSKLQYTIKYIPKDSVSHSDTAGLRFNVVDVLTKPENSTGSELAGSIAVVATVQNYALKIGFDETNSSLFDALKQINVDFEQLDVQFNISYVEYKLNKTTSEYDKIANNSITAKNSTEPLEAIIIRLPLSEQTELLHVNVTVSIASTSSLLSIAKTFNFTFIDDSLAELKPVINKFEVSTLNVTNKVENIQNVVTLNTTNSDIATASSTIIFAPITAMYVQDMNAAESGSTSISDTTNVNLKFMPATYGIKIVSDVEFDLRDYDKIMIVYADTKIKPSQITKDTIFVQLAWKDYSEIGIEINGIISAVLSATNE